MAAGATPAAAQEWATVFQPGEVELPPEGYVQAREAAAWFADFPQRSRLSVTAYESPAEAGSGIGATQSLAMELELVRSGVPDGYVRILQPLPGGVGRGVVITGERLDRPLPPANYIDQMLVFFDPGSTEIATHAGYLLQIYTAPYRPGHHRISVIGRTDTSGSAEANQRLSERRAEAVARFLAAHGVDWADMDVLGKGETQLSRATGEEVAEPLNRLVYVDMRKINPPH